MILELTILLALPKCSWELADHEVVSCLVDKHKNKSVHCGQKTITSDTEKGERVRDEARFMSECLSQMILTIK